MDGTSDNPGIIPRATEKIFETMQEKMESSPDVSYELLFAHVEVYNEKVYDLTSVDRKDMPLRQDKQGQIIVSNLADIPLGSFDDFETLYKKTRENRSTAATKLNIQSSRSHSVLRLTLVKKDKQTGTRTAQKLHLIDLAGSEDNRKTMNAKDRIAESANINKSLFMLNQVVYALNNRATNIPYRNSKLTRMLQNSLGGSASSMMITNISPSSFYYLDTMNALNMAQRTRKIKSKVVEEPPKSAPAHYEPTSRNRKPIKSSAKRKLLDDQLLWNEDNPPASPDFMRMGKNIKVSDIYSVATPNTKAGLIRAAMKSKALGKVRPPLFKKQKFDVKSKVDSNIKSKSKASSHSMRTDAENPIVELSSKTLVDEKENVLVESKAETIQKVALSSNQDRKAILSDTDKRMLQIMNSGNKDMIKSLNGIGDKRAEQILDNLRTGIFENVEQLRSVGITGKLLERIRSGISI